MNDSDALITNPQLKKAISLGKVTYIN